MFSRHRKSNFTSKCLSLIVGISKLACGTIADAVHKLKCLPSVYSGIWVLLIQQLWQAYSSVQKFKEIITFFESVILLDIRV